MTFDRESHGRSVLKCRRGYSVPDRPKSPPAVTIRVGRESKGRRGKGVTLVWDVPGSDDAVKDRVIEIQGDQRDRVSAVLAEMGFKVKRVGDEEAKSPVVIVAGQEFSDVS